jgi:O-antigen ligase
MAHPVTFFVLGVWAAIIASHAARGQLWGIRVCGWDFFKVIPFFLLVVSALDSVKRMRIFMGALVFFTVGLTLIAVLRYYEVIHISYLSALEERRWDVQSQSWMYILRLRSTGMFNDPNDLSLILTVGMIICSYFMADRKLGLLRVVWLAPFLFFGFAFMLTRSRGGLLALGFAGMCFGFSRYGWKKTLPLVILALPLARVLLGDRQTDVSSDTDTGQQRIQLWADALVLFRQSPLFGVGASTLVDQLHHVAHNSYVHSFAELGILGGISFTAIPLLSFERLFKLTKSQPLIADPEVRRLQPYMLAIVACYLTGMLTLTRCYVPPTYLIFGLAAAYIRLVAQCSPVQIDRVSFRLLMRMSIASCALIAAIYLFCRVFAHWGGGGA